MCLKYNPSTNKILKASRVIDARIKENINKFWDCRNINEAHNCFVTLPKPWMYLLVAKLTLSALSKREADVILVAEVLAQAADGKWCSIDDFERGLQPAVACVDDLSVDIPEAYPFVARLLHGSKLPQSTIECLADMITVHDGPLIHPSQKLLTEYAKLKNH